METGRMQYPDLLCRCLLDRPQRVQRTLCAVFVTGAGDPCSLSVLVCFRQRSVNMRRFRFLALSGLIGALLGLSAVPASAADVRIVPASGSQSDTYTVQ